MRTPFLLIIAIAIAGVAILGCSKKSDDPAPCKLLSTVSKDDAGDGTATYEYDGSKLIRSKQVYKTQTIDNTYEYDSKNRLVKVTEVAKGGGDWTVNITVEYNTDHILFSFSSDGGSVSKSKLVYKGSGPKIDYEVDLTSGDTTYWTYQGNNVTQKKSKTQTEVYTYDSKKAFKLINFPGENPDNNVLTHVVTGVTGVDTYTQAYTYTYSTSNYPATATIKTTSGGATTEQSATYTSDCK